MIDWLTWQCVMAILAAFVAGVILLTRAAERYGDDLGVGVIVVLIVTLIIALALYPFASYTGPAWLYMACAAVVFGVTLAMLEKGIDLYLALAMRWTWR